MASAMPSGACIAARIRFTGSGMGKGYIGTHTAVLTIKLMTQHPQDVMGLPVQAPTAAAPMAQATPLQRLMGPSATIAQGPSAQSSALTASTAGAPSTAPNAPMKPALESVVPALTSSFSRAQALQQQYAEEAGLPKAHGLATAPAAMPTGTAAAAAVAQQPHPASAAGVQGAPVATRAPMGPGLQAAVPAIEKSLSRAEAMQQSYEAEVVKAVAPNPSKALPAADAPAYMHVAAMSPAGGAALFQADAMQKFYERSVLGSGQNRMAAGTMDASSSQDEVAPASAVLSATQPHAMRLTAPALSPSVAAEVQVCTEPRFKNAHVLDVSRRLGCDLFYTIICHRSSFFLLPPHRQCKTQWERMGKQRLIVFQ